MKKRFLVLLLVFVLICPCPTMAAVQKNETVYGLLANDGTVKEVQVVNWAYGTPDGDSWTDYGNYREINNSGSDVKPRMGKDQISWPSSAFEEKGLFYQGLTDKELPFKIVIDYTLDGKPIKPEQLAGKNGNLKVNIHLENLSKQKFMLSYQGQQGKQLSAEETLYTPFMFQVSTTIPAGKWKNIKTPGASQVVVGDQIQVAWMVFPFPKEEISLEMQGNNIELNPIEIAALPTVLPLPSLDMDSELNQLMVGLGQLESSLNKMGSAAQEIQRNQEKIADGCSQVAAGLGELEEGVKGAYEGSGQLAGGLEQLRQQLAASNEQLTQQLTELLAQQTQQTQELITQLYQLKQSIPSPQENPENYEAHVRIDALIKNLENPNNVPSLPSLPSQENDPLALLTDAVNMLNSGLGEIHQGTQRLAQETPSLSSGMKELAKGQGQLADGLLKAADGISTTKKESGGQFNELKRGQAVTDKLEILADDYKSFMDNTNNSNSQVQFLLRTEGIEITEPAAESAPEPTKNTPWQSIKNFFKNLFS